LDGSVTSSALNAALRGATEDYAAILWPGDSLAPDAAAIVDAALAREPVSSNQSSVASGEDSRPPSHVPRPSLLYTDEDLLDARGRRCQPHFKPGWSPDTLLDWPYTGNLCLFDRQAALACGGFCSAFATADALLYDLVLRLTERDPRVRHIPAVLYHRHTGPRLSAELTEVRRRAAARRGIPVLFEDAPAAEAWQAIRPALGFASLLALPRLRPLPVPPPVDAGAINDRSPIADHRSPFTSPPPLVSILIPTRNHAADLSACIASIVDRTTYPHLEVLIADNGSDEPAALRYLERIAAGLRTAAGAAVPVHVLRLDIPFNFSILNNRAAAAAAGAFLVFLNNDTEIVAPDWIERMLGHALKPRAGAVGATLLYPGGTIQHAGVATIGSGPTHVFGHLPADYPHPRCQRDGNWSAVTAACMMVDAGKFRAVGGFDESLAVAFNDVDLCYRLLDRGWPAILASQARLIHHEFRTRGHDRASAGKRARMLAELERLFARWPTFRDDPVYNPALAVSYPDFLPQE